MNNRRLASAIIIAVSAAISGIYIGFSVDDLIIGLPFGHHVFAAITLAGSSGMFIYINKQDK